MHAANTLARSSSSSPCRTVLSAGLTAGREPRREQLTGSGVGQVGPGQGDTDAGQVRLVAEGEVDRLVARRELGLERVQRAEAVEGLERGTELVQVAAVSGSSPHHRDACASNEVSGIGPAGVATLDGTPAGPSDPTAVPWPPLWSPISFPRFRTAHRPRSCPDIAAGGRGGDSSYGARRRHRRVRERRGQLTDPRRRPSDTIQRMIWRAELQEGGSIRMQITRSSLDTQKGPADWFTGDVYIDPVAAPA